MGVFLNQRTASCKEDFPTLSHSGGKTDRRVLWSMQRFHLMQLSKQKTLLLLSSRLPLPSTSPWLSKPFGQHPACRSCGTASCAAARKAGHADSPIPAVHPSQSDRVLEQVAQRGGSTSILGELENLSVTGSQAMCSRPVLEEWAGLHDLQGSLPSSATLCLCEPVMR